MFETRVTAEGQTTLPKAVMDSLAVEKGGRIRLVIFETGVMLMPVRSASSLHRSFKYDGPAATLEDMDRAIAEGAAEGIVQG